MTGLSWFGYRHVNGNFHLKRLLDAESFLEAEQSDFVDQVFGPWHDLTREQAQEKMQAERKLYEYQKFTYGGVNESR